ncbi:hypothetical protein GWI33_016387 [Rhynchophorus ferrugineus]|uniref:Uncharacterized protein n=1 Tax=Rhynchophorus ferrugineus TaxID=354439 RepID=A0A834I1U4_RHYFE|nr:hypothetical protein GWI33_016387 [Rhynchophorus ferrugineus]
MVFRSELVHMNRSGSTRLRDNLIVGPLEPMTLAFQFTPSIFRKTPVSDDDNNKKLVVDVTGNYATKLWPRSKLKDCFSFGSGIGGRDVGKDERIFSRSVATVGR